MTVCIYMYTYVAYMNGDTIFQFPSTNLHRFYIYFCSLQYQDGFDL